MTLNNSINIWNQFSVRRIKFYMYDFN